jgi:hypothetical protein
VRHAIGLGEQYHQGTQVSLIQAVGPQRLLQQCRDLTAEQYQQSQRHGLDDRDLAEARCGTPYCRFDFGGALLQAPCER